VAYFKKTSDKKKSAQDIDDLVEKGKTLRINIEDDIKKIN
jgi:hypothetical protein